MADNSESKRLWRTAAIVALAGLFVIVPLVWLAFRLSNDKLQQRVMSANESSALTTLENIQAQEQVYRETNGQYANFQQLTDTGIIKAPTSGDTLVSDGYKFTLKTTPKTDATGPTYVVNADPERTGGRDATGRRHFYISSEVTGIRYNEQQPASASDKPRLSVQDY